MVKKGVDGTLGEVHLDTEINYVGVFFLEFNDVLFKIHCLGCHSKSQTNLWGEDLFVLAQVHV